MTVGRVVFNRLLEQRVRISRVVGLQLAPCDLVEYSGCRGASARPAATTAPILRASAGERLCCQFEKLPYARVVVGAIFSQSLP